MNSDCKYFVFREGRRTLPAEQLLGGLRGSLLRAADENGWVDALLRAGELECGLEDAGDAEASRIAAVTDACAQKLVSWSYSARPELMNSLPLRLAGELTVSTPEGFAYYALHPRQYAEVVVGELQNALVVGIRSIGTALSAMTTAALKRRGAWVKRFTVRPTGHPFDREVKWNVAHLQAICSGIIHDATFVIVDEGPGLSGSSFLSVAEALLKAGVARDKILLVPSHEADLGSLRAADGARRWQQFRSVSVGEGRYPEGEWLGGGEWRRRFGGDSREWPGAWTSLERAKFLAGDVFWKFEGLGPYGAKARTAAKAVGEAGFGPRVVDDQHGYTGYEFVPGRAATREDLSAERMRRLAEYCAFRSEEFACSSSETHRRDLATMLRVNYEREFGMRLPAELSQLEFARTAVCDAKMSPHEWLVASDGRFLKLDATSHGDGHFFPGPCDVAWDLAGAIVEWEMDAATRAAFLREYVALTRDDASRRIANYLLAYAVFRGAWCRMAAAGMKGTAEEERLTREAQRYRAYVERMFTAAAAGAPEARAS